MTDRLTNMNEIFVSNVIGYLCYDVANISTMKYVGHTDKYIGNTSPREAEKSKALKPFTDVTHIRQNTNVAAEKIFIILITDDYSP